MGILDNYLLKQYMNPNQQIQAQIPASVIEQQKKRSWMDKLGQNLIQSDGEYNPSDEDRRKMVKRGLLEAGLSMLANPSGAGNSPLMGISSGLLAGKHSIEKQSDDMRNEALGYTSAKFGNSMPSKVREIQQTARMLNLMPNTPAYENYVKTQMGLLAKATNMSEWKTSVTQSGDLIRYRESGETQFLDKASRQWVDVAGNGTDTTQDEQTVKFSDMSPLEQEAITRLGNGLSTQVSVRDGKVVDDYPVVNSTGSNAVPPRTPTPMATLPNLSKVEPPKAKTWNAPVIEYINGKPVRVQYSPDGDRKELGAAEIAPPAKTETQLNAESNRAKGATEMSRVLGTMLGEYNALNDANGITNTSRGVWDNIGASIESSDSGQGVGRWIGSKNQSNRDTINAMKPQVLSAVIAASGMSAKQLDSNAEMKLWLSAVSDPQTSYQTVVKVTDGLLKKFTGRGIEQFDKSSPAQPTAPAPANDGWSYGGVK